MTCISEKKLTNVIPGAFIKGGGLDFLKKCVRPAMAIKQEPYFGSVTVYNNSHLKQVENNENVVSTRLKRTIAADSGLHFSTP